jgi:hypothetical protein
MLIIFNPVAGRRRAQRLWRVLDIMATSGVRLEIVETQHAGHARELARTAAHKNGHHLVVAAGGDGTIAEVAAGLAGSDCKLGIIPIGTANVLAHELGLTFSPAGVAAALAFGRTAVLWPGAAVGVEGTRLFVQMLGAGFDAQVVKNLSLKLKRAIGRTSYVLQSVRELGRYGFPPITVSLDGKCSEAGSVIVSKGSLYAGRYLVAPGCRPTDRGFSVVLFERPGALQAAMCGAALPLNMIPHMPGVRVMRAEHVELDCSTAPAQTDGDPCGSGRLVISDAPGSIEVVVG